MPTLTIDCPTAGACVPPTFGVIVTWDADTKGKGKLGNPTPTAHHIVRVTVAGHQHEVNADSPDTHRFEFSSVPPGGQTVSAKLIRVESKGETEVAVREAGVTVDEGQTQDPCPPPTGSGRAPSVAV